MSQSIPKPRIGTLVQSGNNAILKVYRRSLAAGVTPEGWLAIEGPILFAEALQLAIGAYVSTVAEKRPVIHGVLATEREAERFEADLRRLPPETEIAIVSERLFRRVAVTETPRGIAALVELPQRSFDTVLSQSKALVVVACGLQDPGNLGTIIRSAQALGGAALVTLANTVSPFNPKALRSSAGAAFRLPIFTALEPESLVHRLRGLGLRIVATDRRSPKQLQEEDLRGPVALLIGQEAAGLDESLRRGTDVTVSVRIRPDTESLNAAAAAAIFLYEAARQRGFRFDEPV